MFFSDDVGIVIAVVVVVIIVLVLCGCIIMNILFCYCCTIKEQHIQGNGTYVHIYVCMYVCVYRVYVFAYICMYVCMCDTMTFLTLQIGVLPSKNQIHDKLNFNAMISFSSLKYVYS